MVHKPKTLRGMAVAVLSMLVLVLAACGDATATTGTTSATTAPAGGATTAPAMATTAGTMMAGTTTGTMMAGTTTGTMMAGTTAPTGGTAATGPTSGKIKVMSSLPRTGSSKGQTDAIVASIKLALKEAGNKAGNFDIEYIDCDDATAAKGGWDAQAETTCANTAINDKDVMVYMGTFNSGAAVISMPLLNNAGIAMISPANTRIGLTHAVAGLTAEGEPTKYFPTGKRNYTRIVASDDFQGPGCANFMTKTLSLKKIFVIDDGQAYGVGLSDAVTATLKATSGVSVVGSRVTIKANDPNGYGGIADQITSSGADGVFYGGTTDNGGDKLLSDLRSAGVKLPFVGGDGINEAAFIKGAGAAADANTYASVAGVGVLNLAKTNPKAAKWLTSFRADQKIANDAEPDPYALYGYELASVVLDAIKRAGTKDRAAILNALLSTKDFDGVLGKWSFDANGDITLKDIAMYQAKGGNWVYNGQAPKS